MKTTKNPAPFNRSFLVSQGCKQVPPEECRNIIRWGHPDGYFLNAKGLKAADNLTPSHIKHCNSHPAPNLSHGGISCHRAMALAHYGPCPVFTDPKTGRKYKGHCHHLIPDPLDYRPANLLCWLTREQHAEADRRQKALSKLVPDLHAFTYERLRELQDPRTMPREEFKKQLTLIPVFTIDPDCDRREPNKHYDPFCERDDPPHGMLNFGVPDANQQSVCSGESVAQNIGVIERCYRESRGVLV